MHPSSLGDSVDAGGSEKPLSSLMACQPCCTGDPAGCDYWRKAQIPCIYLPWGAAPAIDGPLENLEMPQFQLNTTGSTPMSCYQDSPMSSWPMEGGDNQCGEPGTNPADDTSSLPDEPEENRGYGTGNNSLHDLLSWPDGLENNRHFGTGQFDNPVRSADAPSESLRDTPKRRMLDSGPIGFAEHRGSRASSLSIMTGSRRRGSRYNSTKKFWCAEGCQGTGFTLSQNLNRHIRDYHPKEGSICPCCPEGSIRRYGRPKTFLAHLKLHITGRCGIRHHPEAEKIWREEQQKKRPRAP
ncbi:hypothetical protein GE09DRAFT_662042 [Coniochaeta sp. 2T2.1]|nr:hypothetical protein GE09DRAFT_472874 [Coniochaeta sp. 2T2.1]KAB5572207.1 hypothetical protein GE09DRAFT_662042 [Coniochaeta sp. 2T2.1]